VATYALVNADTLETGLAAASIVDDSAHEIAPETVASTPYLESLASTHDDVLQTVNSAVPGDARFILTVDMCQSSKAWEKGLFDWLVNLSHQRGHAIEVGVAMTGLWATHHPNELARLFGWKASGELDILWINHSYHHQLSPDASGHYRFLTDPSIDFPAEVLA